MVEQAFMPAVRLQKKILSLRRRPAHSEAKRDSYASALLDHEGVFLQIRVNGRAPWLDKLLILQ
jgi:hypothetical protein